VSGIRLYNRHRLDWHQVQDLRLADHNFFDREWRFMNQPYAWLMIRRRAAAVGIDAPIGCYLANGGALEHAQEMAAHESPRTTKL
jgi:hypothetical protein